MFYRKSLEVKESKNATLTFDDFSGGMDGISVGEISAATADICFNTEGSYGALRQGLGFDRPGLDAPVCFPKAKSIACVTLDTQGKAKRYLAVVSADGNLALYPEDNPQQAVQVGATVGDVKLMAYEYGGKRCLLFCDDECLHIYDGNSILNCGAATIKPDSLTVYYERVFGISTADERKLLFSKQLDPTDWLEGYADGGFITPPDNFGAIVALASYDDCLYAFGAHKIAEITAKAPQGDFTVKRVFASHGEVLGGTVAVSGDGIYFLTTEGVYLFDGDNSKKITDLGGKLGISGGETACVYGSRYFLACDVDFGDGRRVMCEKAPRVNNALVSLSADGCLSVSRGMDIRCLSASEGKDARLLFVSGGEIGQVTDSGKFFDRPLPKVWQTAEGDLGTAARKTIKAVNIYTLHAMTLSVTADGKEKRFEISGGKEYKRVKIGVTGYRFRFAFITDAAKPLIIKPIFEISY